MNSLVALLLLGQIIGCTFSHHLPSHVPVDCNGEDAEKWADLAVNYINKHNLHGYKYAVNVIKEIFVLPRNGDLVAVFLKLNLLDTECHVLDPTPVENCTVRPQHYHDVEMVCDAKIMFNVKTFKEDFFFPDSVEDVQQKCPKCPILLPLSDPHVVDSVEYVLNKHNEKLSGHIYEVLEISRGQHKYEPEAYYVEFVIVEVNCTAQEAHDDHHQCHPYTSGEEHIGFCRATVFRSHASLEKPKDEKFESDCVIFDIKDGHAHSHLIQQHIEKNSISPEHNITILNFVHPDNHTSTSHESHEHVADVPVAFVKKELPTDISDHHTTPVKGCPGKVHHFRLY
ncbi:antihemorrhagic factor HSF-like [Protobothrops mucrosquamatus]|uniref:antihemorrhagic factor HSF-like n=1 Tax=Protobothrops mucrosquamatus TaxID=103944 RepID=UPI000775EFC3|nr:antihemorrhagic factor HSF-like [Protobothrops mucrosquamatus]